MHACGTSAGGLFCKCLKESVKSISYNCKHIDSHLTSPINFVRRAMYDA